MKKRKGTLSELTLKNKEELLKDKVQIEKIEKRIEDRYLKNKT